MTAERADETYSGLRCLCPSCKIPILVGKHSVTIDRERIREEAMNELMNAAIDIRDNPGTDLHCDVGFRAIELPKLKRLRDALATIDKLLRR